MKRAIVLVAVLALIACAHFKKEMEPLPTEDELRLKEYVAGVAVSEVIPDLPPIDLPPYPTQPPAGASEEIRKAYALEVQRVKEIRATKRDAWIRARELQIEAHNKFAREHQPPTPTPTPKSSDKPSGGPQ